MQPNVLKKFVFADTSIQYLDFPSVTKIESYAFGNSKLKSLIVENCKFIDAEAFIDEYI